MKLKRLLSVAMMSVFLLGGGQTSWADTDLLTTANGWQKVTDLSSLTLTDYYFAFVDKDKPLMLSFETGLYQSNDISYKTMVYRTEKKAENTPTMLWTLEKNSNGTSYTIKSAVDQSKFLQTEGNNAAWYCRTHDNGGGNDSWGAWNFNLADGAYTIENNTFKGKYLGFWDPALPQNGMSVAGNKTGNDIDSYYIYAISRSKVDWLNNASEDNPVDVTYNIVNPNATFGDTNGWTAEGTNVKFERSSGYNKNTKTYGTFDGIDGFFEPSNWGAANFDFNTTQTISNLPAGKYKVRAAGQAETNTTFTMTCGDDVYTFPANSTTGGTIDQGGNIVASGSGVAGWTWGECSNILRTDGNLTITFHSLASQSQRWANFDNVELYFLGKTVSGKAQSVATASISAEANKWYVFDVQKDGDYRLSLSTGTVSYTQDGTLLPSEVTTSTDKTTELQLTSGKLYVLASADASIAVEALNLYPIFAELYPKCKPWTTGDEYANTYNSYASYSESTPNSDLQSAIDYLNANYDTYAWDNASMEHPYLVDGVIAGADNTTNDAWPGNGRPLANGQHWSGDASRQYFTQNVRPNAARSQSVTIPKTGVYMLKTAVRTINGKGKAYAIISVGNQSTSTNYATGTTGGTIATDGTEYESVEAGIAAGATFANGGKGYGWVYNKVMFVTTAENTQTNISINLSHVSEDGEADCGGMYLYYVGQGADNIVGNTHYYYGAFTNPTMEVTDDVPVVDATLATVNGATITRTNPNGLLYLANGSTTDGGQNVIVDGTCANFVLTDGHPFAAPKAFSATKATYTMTAIADGKFGTLMLPFAAQLPADGKAYALDADIDVVGGKVNGSEVTALTANTPVLVTKAGAYTGSNVDIAATTATSFTNGNLTGIYAQTEAPQGSYVLQNHPQSQGVAFYLVGDVKPIVKPFRAYIPAQSSNAKAIKVVFDGEATAIDGITADEGANENVYDLSGRKVVKAHKGIYIKNGKKVIVK